MQIPNLALHYCLLSFLLFLLFSRINILFDGCEAAGLAEEGMLQQLARGLPLVRVEGERGVEEGAEVRGDGVDGLDLRLAAARDQIHRAHRRLAHVRRLALPRQGDVELFITMLFNFLYVHSCSISL